MRANIICGVILLVVAGTFWSQRDYGNRQEGLYPDLVLIVLAVLGVGIALMGILRGDRTRRPRELNLRMFVSAAALIVAWSFALGMIGFTLSGIIAFVIMAQMVRRGRPRASGLVKDLVAAVVVTVGCFLIFTQVLLVPLPVSTLIGI